MISESDRVANPKRFELVSYRGEIFGPYDRMEAAKEKWPEQSQDEDRSGRGWDVQVVQP